MMVLGKHSYRLVNLGYLNINTEITVIIIITYYNSAHM